MDRLAATLDEECKHLCSLKFFSVLRKCTPEQLSSLCLTDLLDEWKREPPLLHRFLLTISCCKGVPSNDKIPPICMAGSILLRTRNIHMSAMQHYTGLLLFHGNATKQVCMNILVCTKRALTFQTVVRLNKLQVCTSSEATLHKVDECAEGHDDLVTQWMSSQREYINCE